MKMNGSHAIVRSLLAEGVETIFGYPGGAIMPAYDALYDYQDQIRHVLVRHEQGAAHAAEGYARITGKAGVCIATSGPGATNLVTGIADAMLDSIPLVCLIGQVTKGLLGTDAFQETDVMGITMPITKWNYQVTNAQEIPAIMAKAFYIAQNGRPGPVVLDITKNAQFDPCDFSYQKLESLNSFTVRPPLNAEAIETAAKLINEAKRPYILLGHGVLIAKAQEEVRKLCEHAGIPVACTLHGLSSIPVTHPNYVGMLGMHGNYGPNVLTNQADLIVAIGMRFDDRVTGNTQDYGRKARIIHIDIDPAEMNKNIQTTVGIVADAKEALQALLPLVNEQRHDKWMAEFKRCQAEEEEKVIRAAVHPKEGELKMGEVIRAISDETEGNAVVVSDVGQHQMMSARYYNFNTTDAYITSGGLGTMGFAIPAALGAKLADPHRQVIAFCGDGGFQMTCQELGTISQEGAPVKIVILNNNFLGMVRQWQELFFDKRYSFVHLVNPNFIKLAEAFGIEGEVVENRDDLAGAVKRMVKSEKAYVLDVRVEKEHNVFPMVPAGASVTDIRLE